MAIKTSFARWAFGAAVAAASLASVSAFAAAPAVPVTLTQQGRILDTSGAPVASKVKIVFTVYDAATGGTSLWTETQNITLDDGYFSAELGSASMPVGIPSGVFDGSKRYLGVTVGSDAEMTPRQAVTSVPYAMKAATADVANSAAFTSLSGIPAPCATGMYLTGYNATGVAQCSTLPALSCTTRYTAATAGTSVDVGCDQTSDYKIMTGGGCESNVALTGSFPHVCTFSPVSAGSVGATAVIGPPIIIGQFCNFATFNGNWYCSTASSGSTRAYATCCKVL